MSETVAVITSTCTEETPEIPAQQNEIADEYVARLRQLSEAMGCEVRPLHDGIYDWGLDQLKADNERADEVLDRPSGSTGTRMTPKSCKNYVGELGRFFGWLHRQPRFQWGKPDDFDDIKRTPREFGEDIEYGALASSMQVIAEGVQFSADDGWIAIRMAECIQPNQPFRQKKTIKLVAVNAITPKANG